MGSDYDDSFAPYVIPAGLPWGPDVLPDWRWTAKMALSQARGLVGGGLVRLRHSLPGALSASRVARGLEALQGRVVPTAPGRIPTHGDAEFAYQRFAGTNPLVIARVRRLQDVPEKLRLSDEIHGRVMGGGSAYTQRVNRSPTADGASGCQELGHRIERGDVFIARYDALRVGSVRDLQPGKFLIPTTVLFCHAPEMDAPFAVVPLAIQCATGRPDGETAVFTPLSEARWRAAKRLAGVADVNMSELCLHLARTHFMTVPFAIALRRKLPRAHPIHLFLLPHLRFNLFVDRMAWHQGVRTSRGVLVRSLAGRAEWCRDVARSVYYAHSFREQHFERDLEARGLDAHPVDYPYRDDGRLLWNAIKRFAEGYIHRVYPNDRALATDAPLHEFLREVAARDGGNVRGLLSGERLETRSELTEILTQVLFVAGPLHALAHYSSAAQLQQVEENPSFLTGNPLSALDDTEPGPVGAMDQYTRVVGTNSQYDRLGGFSRHELGRRPEHAALIAAFQADLRVIEETIATRNTRRFAPFIHFMPSRISNGITV